RPLGPHDLGPRLGDRALEGATKTGGDVSLGRSGERRIHRVEATGDAREAGDRGVDVARRRIADAVVGAEVAIVAGEGHAGHAGTARARLDAVAHVLVVAARDPGAGERVVHASGDRVAGIVGARIAVVAHERRNGGADTGDAGGAAALPEGVAVRVDGAGDARCRRPGRAVDGRLAARVAVRSGRAVGGAVVALLARLDGPVPAHRATRRE